ncbi:esterase [Aureococcus anophagefferens]|nr:esterase [Aureococcus anophagefferens]
MRAAATRAAAAAVLLAASARAVTYETLSLGSCVANVNLIVPSNPTSLIVAFHGSGDDADGLEQLLMTGILLDEEDFSDDEREDIYAREEAEALLEARGVMLAVANGHESECWIFGEGRFWYATSTCCSCFHAGVCDQDDDRMQLDSDYARFLAIHLYQNYATLDPRRLFVYGFSNGGVLAQRVACDHADLFAGVWSQAGALVAGAGDYTDLADNAYCSPSSPIHVVNEHAVGDSAIPYDGGSVSALVESLTDCAWANHNCDDASLPAGGDAMDADAWDAYVDARSGAERDWIDKTRYLDALANFTERAKPADVSLPSDLVAGDDAYLSTGWCGVSPCTSDADCPPPFGCVFPAGSRKLLFGYFSNEPGTCA